MSDAVGLTAQTPGSGHAPIRSDLPPAPSHRTARHSSPRDDAPQLIALTPSVQRESARR